MQSTRTANRNPPRKGETLQEDALSAMGARFFFKRKGAAIKLTEHCSRPYGALLPTKESTVLDDTEHVSIYLRSTAHEGREDCSTACRGLLLMTERNGKGLWGMT